MFKFTGQSLWVVEEGCRYLDRDAPFALNVLIQALVREEVEFSTGFEIASGELAKAEAMIGPPSVPEPLLTYCKWYLKCLEHAVANERRIESAHVEVGFGPPDVQMPRQYVFDLYADVIADPNASGKEVRRVLWIDIFRALPTDAPQRIVEGLK